MSAQHTPPDTNPTTATQNPSTGRAAPEGMKWARGGEMCPEWGNGEVLHWSGRRLLPIAETPTQPDKPEVKALERNPEPGHTAIPAFLLKDH